MRFVIVGAGALGTILAAHLQSAGHDVRLLVRGNRAKQLMRDGLIVEGISALRTKCTIETDPAAIDATDVLIVATKTYQTPDAVAPLSHLKAGAVFSIANGVKKNEQLLEVFDRESVLGCMANVSGELLEDGRVAFTRNVCLHLGALEAQQQTVAADIAAVMDEAGIVCRAETDIRSVEWSKQVGWVAFMALSVTTRSKTIDFLLNKHHASLAARLIKEMSLIAQAERVHLIDQSPMPVKTIADGSMDEAVAAIMGMGEEFKATAPDHRMSSLQDLERGARLEHEDTLGYAAALAERHVIDAPTIRDCYDLVAGIDRINRA